MSQKQPPKLHDLSHIKRAVFVSDIHLTSTMPLTAQYFHLFFREYSKSYDAVFILGDLFEYWVGDEVLNASTGNSRLFSSICYDLAQRRNVFFIRGNRDFLTGDQLLKASKMIVLPDPCYAKIGGAYFWLAHGDGWCFLDKKYQAFRWLTRKPLCQKFFLDLPYTWREGVAQRLRQSSTQNRQTTSQVAKTIPAWADVPEAELTQKCLKIFQNRPLNYIIHGHTHQPAIHTHGQTIKRWVLPDWDQDGPVMRGELLVFENNTLGWRSALP